MQSGWAAPRAKVAAARAGRHADGKGTLHPVAAALYIVVVIASVILSVSAVSQLPVAALLATHSALLAGGLVDTLHCLRRLPRRRAGAARTWPAAPPLAVLVVAFLCSSLHGSIGELAVPEVGVAAMSWLAAQRAAEEKNALQKQMEQDAQQSLEETAALEDMFKKRFHEQELRSAEAAARATEQTEEQHEVLQLQLEEARQQSA